MAGMRIAVVGTGYVGTVTAACLAAAGHDVVCVDERPDRIRMIQQGRAPFFEPGLPELLAAARSAGRLRATTDVAEAIAASDVTLIAVGTPISDAGVDLSQLTAVSRQIGRALRSAQGYHVVAVRSTVVPGTTETLVRRQLEQASGRQAGQFGLCMNPEFLREGSAVQDATHPDRVVIGEWDQRSGEALSRVYAPFDCPIIRTTLRNAELVKCASNALLAALISFSNELAGLCEATPGTDVDVVLRTLHLDHRLSPIVDGKRVTPGILSYLRAGCSFGGSCLPKDLKALQAYAVSQGLVPYLLNAAMTVNLERPGQVIRLAEQALGSLNGAVVAVLGLAFKPETDDMRNAPSLSIIHQLLRQGATVAAYDPVASVAARAHLDERVRLCGSAAEACDGANAAILVTAWPEFATLDWPAVTARMRRPVIVDGRNALRHLAWSDGVRYLPIGVAPAQGASGTAPTSTRSLGRENA